MKPGGTTTKPATKPVPPTNTLALLTTSARRCFGTYWPVPLIAVVAFLVVAPCVDPTGNYPQLPEGPGLTIDEVFNVGQGYHLAKMAESLGWLNLVPGTSFEAFRPENGYLPDHPPLGRLWLGIHHEVVRWMFPPVGKDQILVTACARIGSATAFALTVFLIGAFTTHWYGRAAGCMAAVSLVLMPRVFGHAHLASLESMVNLTWIAAVLSIAEWWNGPNAPRVRTSLLTGALFGLALLTKIQAVLIPVPVVCWALWRWRGRAIGPLAVWSLAATIVFFAGWPYLWYDSVSHLLEYLGRTTNRVTLYVWYFGQKYQDKEVPWHYPFVIFALTVPVVLHALGLLELAASLRNAEPPQPTEQRNTIPDNRASADVLLFGCLLWMLIVFALPGIAVYDCERLFLPSFVLWSIFIGRGWVRLWNLVILLSKSPAIASLVCSVLLVETAAPLVMLSPCHLCYYNEITSLAMGGPDKAGLEIDYWAVGLTRGILAKTAELVPEGTNVGISPTLHHLQARTFRTESPILRSRQLNTVECDLSYPDHPKYVLVYRRRADCPERWNLSSPDNPLAVEAAAGIPAAYLLRVDD